MHRRYRAIVEQDVGKAVAETPAGAEATIN
jgi:hypothetical protein